MELLKEEYPITTRAVLTNVLPPALFNPVELKALSLEQMTCEIDRLDLELEQTKSSLAELHAQALIRAFPPMAAFRPEVIKCMRAKIEARGLSPSAVIENTLIGHFFVDWLPAKGPVFPTPEGRHSVVFNLMPDDSGVVMDFMNKTAALLVGMSQQNTKLRVYRDEYARRSAQECVSKNPRLNALAYESIHAFMRDNDVGVKTARDRAAKIAADAKAVRFRLETTGDGTPARKRQHVSEDDDDGCDDLTEDEVEVVERATSSSSSSSSLSAADMQAKNNAAKKSRVAECYALATKFFSKYHDQAKAIYEAHVPIKGKDVMKCEQSKSGYWHVPMDRQHELGRVNCRFVRGTPVSSKRGGGGPQRFQVRLNNVNVSKTFVPLLSEQLYFEDPRDCVAIGLKLYALFTQFEREEAKRETAVVVV